FKNPFKQNDYHLRALKEILPHTELYSVVVFTNDDCELKVKNDNHELVLCSLQNLVYHIDKTCLTRERKYSINDIEKRFYALKDFSRLSQIKVEQTTEHPLEFYEFFNTFKEDFEKIKIKKLDEFDKQKKLLETEYEKKKGSLQKEKKHNSVFLAIGIIVCFVISILICSSIKSTCDSLVAQAEQERIKMEQNFQHVDETNIPYNDILNDCLELNCTLKNGSVANTVMLQGNIKLLTQEYGIRLNENSKYIVIKKDGTSYQYDIFDSNNTYNSFSNTLHPNGYYSKGKLKDFNFINIGKTKDIAYIKMTNVTLFDATNYSNSSYSDNLEIEIYSVE
ncbi:MAG: hypothetical protein IKU15_03860, partial [Clostridia bacterium]|nr:hypothetical protein [Clostridia bacterium]